MANNIVIRMAKKDYVCDCCGKVIRTSTEYLDKVTLNDGKCVRHERYHDECPKAHPMVRLMELIIDSDDNELLVIDAANSIKYKIRGVDCCRDNVYEVRCLTWDGAYKIYAWPEVKKWQLPDGRTLEEACK